MDIAERLYKHIEHGDAEHRAWLKQEVDAFCAANLSPGTDHFADAGKMIGADVERAINQLIADAQGMATPETDLPRRVERDRSALEESRSALVAAIASVIEAAERENEALLSANRYSKDMFDQMSRDRLQALHERDQLLNDIEDLKHDVSRHMQIAAEAEKQRDAIFETINQQLQFSRISKNE